MLCRWAKVPDVWQDRSYSILLLETEQTMRSFQTPGTTSPAIQRNILEDLNLQQHRYERLKSRTICVSSSKTLYYNLSCHFYY